jgi:Smg protein
MKENMMDVLMYLFEHYMDERQEIAPDQDSLKSKLIGDGFPKLEVDKAFSWLEGLALQRHTDMKAQLHGQRAMRIYTGHELELIDTESRGFLQFLEQMEVLTPVTRELVVERAMALELGRIDLEKLKWVILMVLFNQPGQEAAYAWVEDFVFDEMESYLH